MTISVHDIRVNLFLGSDPQAENAGAADVLVDLRVSLHKRIRKDQLSYTVDYAFLASQIVRDLQNKRFVLLETVASEILKLLKMHRQIGSAWVQVKRIYSDAPFHEVAVTCSY